MNPQEVEQIVNTNCRLADDYHGFRVRSVQSRVDLRILMLPHLDEFPKSMSIENKELAFCKENEHAQQLYRTALEDEAQYKGIEMIIKANEHKINWAKKVLIDNQQGENRGY